MIFYNLQSMILIAGNILLLFIGLCLTKVFGADKKILSNFLSILWIIAWLLIMFVFMDNQATFAMIIKGLATVVYLSGFVGLCGLVFALRKFKRIYFVVYDFFLFFKSRIILPKKNVTYTFTALQLLETYINFITKYIVNKEFLPAHTTHGLHKDKYLNFVLNFTTYGGVFCMFNEIFAHEVYKFNSSTPNPKIIDCGSNIGLSILYFKSLYPHAEIIGFEPGPETFDLLKKNIEDNNLKNVEIHNKALADKSGHLTFFVCKENPAHGGWSVGSEPNADFQKIEQQIPCVRLSEYINGPIDFLKIDIEGAENQVLKDLAENNKLGLVKRIILEYHHHMIDTMQDDLSHVLKYLEDNGFGYQFNFIEKPTPENKRRNTIILYAYNKRLPGAL